MPPCWMRLAGQRRWKVLTLSQGCSNGAPIQEISDTVGHKSTHVTDTVYRTSSFPRFAEVHPSWTLSLALETQTGEYDTGMGALTDSRLAYP
jgi:hypothetical protein